jgi:stage V sporulation protein SpoVS
MTMKKPEQVYSFTSHEQNQPGVPLPGDRIDAQFGDHQEAIQSTQDALDQIRRSDGKLRNGIVNKDALDPAIVDDLTKDIRKDVALDVQTIQQGAVEARLGAQSAKISADTAEQSAQEAKNASEILKVSSGSVLTRIKNALASLLDIEKRVSTAAVDTDNAANHALYAQNLADEYAVASAHWAEHMPDTIPPNILAVMGITGEHWSSRWWAHRAGEIVQNEIEDLCKFFVGAYPAPPTTCQHGDPLVPGTMYWNTSDESMYVWTGDEWRALVLPSPADLQEFHYTTTGGGLIGGTDMFGRVPGDLLSPSANVNVYLNGIRLLEANDWYVADATHVRLSRVPATGSVVTVERMDAPQTVYAATAGKIDVGLWTFDGVSKSFPIYVNGQLFSPANAANVLVELGGRMQEAGVDYKVVGSNIIFTDAPAPGTNAWGLVGMPLGPDEIGVLIPSPSAYGRYTYAAVADGQVYFGGADKFGNELKGLLAPNAYVNVHINGVRIEDDEYELASDVELKLDRGVSYGTSVVIELSQVAKLNFTLPPLVAATAYKIDTDKWVFDGVTTTFPIFVNGVPFAPTSEVGINLSLAGVMQEPVDDFIVAGTDLTFSTAPPYDSDCWAIIGVATSGMKEHNHDCGVFG